MYAVVEFLRGNLQECAVVPTIWLSHNNRICSWPKTKSEAHFTDLVKSRTPYDAKWPTYAVHKVVHTGDDYQEAMDKNADFVDHGTSDSGLNGKDRKALSDRGKNKKRKQDKRKHKSHRKGEKSKKSKKSSRTSREAESPVSSAAGSSALDGDRVEENLPENTTSGFKRLDRSITGLERPGTSSYEKSSNSVSHTSSTKTSKSAQSKTTDSAKSSSSRTPSRDSWRRGLTRDGSGSPTNDILRSLTRDVSRSPIRRTSGSRTFTTPMLGESDSFERVNSTTAHLDGSSSSEPRSPTRSTSRSPVRGISRSPVCSTRGSLIHTLSAHNGSRRSSISRSGSTVENSAFYNHRSAVAGPAVNPVRINPPTSVQEQFFGTLEKVSQMCERNQLLLAELSRGNSKSLDVPDKPSDTPIFPIGTIHLFERYDRCLGKSVTHKTYFVKRLAALGGQNPRKATMNMMRFVMTDQVAMEFNWAGHGTKESFEKKKTAECITEAVRTEFKIRNGATDENIHNAIKDWLKQAKRRRDARNSR